MYKTALIFVLLTGAPVLSWSAVPFDGVWLNNPFEPSGSTQHDMAQKKEPSDRFELNGILVSDTRRQASINGKFVREGEALMGSRVEKIERDRVILNRNGKRIVLRRTMDSGLQKQ